MAAIQAAGFLSNQAPATDQTGGMPGELGKEEFLKLLITKLKHQDPLNPIQDEDFIAQLAQFRSLESMQNIYDVLEKSLNSDFLLAQSISNAMVTTLIGKEVKIATEQFELKEDGSIQFAFRAGQTAKSALLTVYDANGSVVYTKDLGPVTEGDHTFSWDGTTGEGGKAAAGTYRIEVQLLGDEGEELEKAATFIRGVVTAVKYENGSAALVVNGQLFNVGDVVEVRQTG